MTSEPIDSAQQELYDLAQIHQVKSRLHAKSIRSVITRLMSERGYAAEQSAKVSLEQWRVAVGPELARLTRPGNIKRGQILIEVSDSVTLQELHFQRTRILKQLQAGLPELKIKDLRIRIVT